MSTEQVTSTLSDGVLTLTLNRPDKLNAYTAQMGRELAAAFRRADADDAVRVVIVTGAGRHFCAGADISGGADSFGGNPSTDLFGDAGKPRQGGGFIEAIFDCRKPSIAAINGAAVGVGLTLTLPMDIRLAAPGTKFGFVFTRRGLVPEAASAWFLPRIVGLPQALRWCYSGRVFDAAEAERGGLVEAVERPEDLLPRAMEIAREIVDHTAPVATALTRQMLWRFTADPTPRGVMSLDGPMNIALGASADVGEGVSAFLEKRAPAFPGKVSTDMPPQYPLVDDRMSDDRATLQAGLDALLPRLLPRAQHIAGLQRLSAGATLQTWAFDAVGEGYSHPLILRRSPGGLRGNESLSLPLEAALITALAGRGVPLPEVLHTLVPADGIGDGFLMTRIPGETIARKIQRDEPYAEARKVLVAQLGAAAGALHRVPTALLPKLPVRSVADTLAALQRRCEALPQPNAVFEFALRWLRRHQPAEPAALHLVHGDFRLGNVIVGAEGLHAVLDWEIAHLGDPAEDLAWVCLPPWRFGQITQPVAGLGQRDELFAAWQAATGEAVDPARVRWWQAAGSLRWGLGCAGMRDWFESGRDATVERAMIARRVSENEIDLLRLLDSEDACA